jgi:hypothetical protein
VTIELATEVAGTTTARKIITRACRALGATDINEEPSPNETEEGLDTLNAMFEGWAARNLLVTDQTATGTTSSGSTEVTDIETAALARGMNVSGTGIAAGTRIESIDDRHGTITLSAAATASGTVSLTFAVLPFQARHEQGLVALLAMHLAPQVGIDAIPGMVARNAHNGMSAIHGQYMRRTRSAFDVPISEQRSVIAIDE